MRSGRAGGLGTRGARFITLECGNDPPYLRGCLDPVRDLAGGRIIGTTRYHDIIAEIDRVEIGYTWYAKSWQRTHVNTTCKLLVLAHAFDTLGCKVVGLRTDSFNFTSQRAIEALGAKKDGVIRHYQARADGSARDTVMYSILAGEWPDVRRHLQLRLARHGEPIGAI